MMIGGIDENATRAKTRKIRKRDRERETVSRRETRRKKIHTLN